MLGKKLQGKNMAIKAANRRPIARQKIHEKARKMKRILGRRPKAPEERAIIARLYEQTRGKQFGEARAILRKGLKSFGRGAIASFILEQGYFEGVKIGRKSGRRPSLEPFTASSKKIWENPDLLWEIDELYGRQNYVLVELIRLYKLAGCGMKEFLQDVKQQESD
jgi:hypothetical protein